MDIAAQTGVVHRVESTDNAAHGFGQRAIEICIGIIVQQVVGQKRFNGDIGILRITAAILIGITGRHLRTLIEMCGLDCKTLTGLVLMLPVFTDLGDHAAEFMADNGRMFSNIIGHALMLGTLNGRLIRAHADGIRNDLDLNVVRADLRQLDLLEAQIHLTVDSNSFCLHVLHLPFKTCPPLADCNGYKMGLCCIVWISPVLYRIAVMMST